MQKIILKTILLQILDIFIKVKLIVFMGWVGKKNFVR